MIAVRTGLVAAVLAQPRAALACAMCMSAPDGTREAYYATTVLLILVPVAAFAAIAWWLVRAARRRAALSADPARPTPVRGGFPADC